MLKLRNFFVFIVEFPQIWSFWSGTIPAKIVTLIGSPSTYSFISWYTARTHKKTQKAKQFLLGFTSFWESNYRIEFRMNTYRFYTPLQPAKLGISFLIDSYDQNWPRKKSECSIHFSNWTNLNHSHLLDRIWEPNM